MARLKSLLLKQHYCMYFYTRLNKMIMKISGFILNYLSHSVKLSQCQHIDRIEDERN